MNFQPTTQGDIHLFLKDRSFRLHPHAFGQIVARLDGCKKASDWAYEPETAPEFAAILNKKMWRQVGAKYLVRSVEDEVRGVLSDKYRRLDVRPQVEALVQTAIKKHGAVPYDAKILPTSFHMKLVLPDLYEPLPNEVGVFGLTYRNSDYGAGRVYIRGFFNRLWCTNLAMCEDALSQVHLGRALSDDITFSQRTYELDSQTMASAIEDVVDQVFSKENILLRMMTIKEAADESEKVDVGAILKGMVKAGDLQKGESEAVAASFNGADVLMLPPGQSRHRLGNAIALVAQTADPDRQLELESLAGRTMGLVRATA